MVKDVTDVTDVLKPTEAIPATDPVACVHCGQKLAAADPAPFCCAGCRGAAAILSACGLTDFHTFRSGVAPLRPTAPAADDAWVDSVGFRTQHEHPRSDGLVAIRWRVEGIHCAACVWLLERLPRLDPGIRRARVNLADDAVDLVVDAQACPPSRQRALVASLGYRLRPFLAGEQPGPDRRERRARLLRFAVAAGSALGSMHVSVTVLAGDMAGDMSAATRALYGWTAVAVALPGLTFGAAAYWRGLFASWRVRRVTVEAITAIVIVVSLLAAVVANIRGRGDLYVDAAAMLVTLLSGARLILAGIRERIQRQLGRGGALFGESARRLSESTDVDELVPVAEVMPGDRLRITAGVVIPADGIIISGQPEISLAVLTGESRPQRIEVGETVWAGSRCRTGSAIMRCTAVGSATRVGKMIAESRVTTTDPSVGVDAWLRWFAPAMLVVLAATGLWWAWWDPSYMLNAMVAVLLISCPCALGIALPLASAMVLARAERAGIFVRDPQALLRVTAAHSVVFDKTGTVTAGAPVCTAWDVCGTPEELTWVFAVASRSEHPLSRAVVLEAANRGILPAAGACTVRTMPGQGIEADTPLGLLRVGRRAWVGPENHHNSAVAATGAGSVVAAALGERIIFQAYFHDDLLAEALPTVRALQHAGLRVELASGDNPLVVRTVAHQLGIVPDYTHAACLPDDKAALIRKLQTAGPVVMVGDGINDAAAMAQADFAIGVQGGLITCLDRCDVVVPHNGVSTVPMILAAGAHLRTTMQWCLGFSLLYHLCGIAAIWAGLIGPILCAIAMPASSLTVVAMVLRCRAFSGRSRRS